MGNHQLLVSQGNDINEMKRKGYEAADILRDANREQAKHRDGIVKIANTNNVIAMDIETADSHTRSIQLAQYKQKLMLVGAIILLFISFILILFIRIFR